MDQAAVANRLLIVMASAVVSPWLDKRFGIQMTPVDTVALIVLAYHYLAAVCEKGVAAFVMYFPPKNPTAPVEPAKVNP